MRVSDVTGLAEWVWHEWSSDSWKLPVWGTKKTKNIGSLGYNLQVIILAVHLIHA